jgi:hypothetical protein
LKKFVVAVKKSLEDGWQPGTDISAVIASAISELVPAMQGVEQLPAEFVMEKEEFITGLGISVKEIVLELLKAPPVPVEVPVHPVA